MPPVDPIDALDSCATVIEEAILELGDIDPKMTERWQRALDNAKASLSFPWTVRP